MKIGGNLQEIIQRKGMDPETVYTGLGWEPEAFQRILADEVSPSISDVLRLANLLEVDISFLLYGNRQRDRKAVITRANERVSVNRRDFMNYESLAPAYGGKHMEPFVVDIFPKKDGGVEISRHSGEEFLFLLSGRLQITVSGEPHVLETGDSFYFDSSQPHALESLVERSRMVAVIYNSESMLHMTKGKRMKSLIEAARLLERRTVVVICPDKVSLSAVNKAIQERLVQKAILVGDRDVTQNSCQEELIHSRYYEFLHIPAVTPEYEAEAALAGTRLIAEGKGEMLMKGKINTANFVKAVLHKEYGISAGRRLSMVSLFELPGVDRLVLLTDAGINPELFLHQAADSGVDIIDNAIDVGRSLGIDRPRVALLEANEVPSAKIPTTMLEKELSERIWKNADVYGPLSYDLALYPESVAKKGMDDNPVAGKADILVVPNISGGNFLYKTWVMTLGADVANIIVGAGVPIILTSRSDNEVNKFLTICAGSIYSHYLQKKAGAAPQESI